jgi:hypothetical protein
MTDHEAFGVQGANRSASALMAVITGRFVALEQAAGRFAERPLLSCLVPGALAIGIAVATSATSGIPLPSVHDEFAYLLAADTFAAGRVTNPPHPMGRHFAEIHVLERPTRAAKYPPGQGLLLALGQTVFGHPIAGVWLGIGLACAVMVWMLRALVPPQWALFGGFLTAIHPLTRLWESNYWGGGLAMAGAALALGAFFRLERRDRLADAMLLAVGFVILSLTRPFEGAVLAAALLLLLLRRRKDVALPRRPMLRLWAPVALVLAVDLAGLAWYDQQVTGSAWQMPHMLYMRQYGSAPVFLWMQPSPVPTFEHDVFRQLADWEFRQYALGRAFPGLIVLGLMKVAVMLTEVVAAQFLCALSLVGIGGVLRRNRSGRTLLLLAAVGLAALWSETYFQYHYGAPFVPPLIALAVLSLRHVNAWSRDRRRLGRRLIRIGVVASLALLPWSAPSRPAWAAERAKVEAELEKLPGDHLVIVRYSSDHDPHADWVHNPADVDAARVIWARDMGPDNGELLDYYKTRSVWLLEPDIGNARPEPFRR